MNKDSNISINGRSIGPGHPVYIIAELSANHGGDFDEAVRIVRAMKEAGADAVKLQTYTADTLTIDCDSGHFRIGGGTLWDGRTLHELYGEASMPWEWQPKLKDLAKELGMDCFSSPFDASAVDFLEEMGVPTHKIASFELVDLPLIRRVAATGKPMILSTGMASEEEIEEALGVSREAGARQIALLKCTSSYPADAAQMHLRTIPVMQEKFGVPVGLSDHTMGTAVPVTAVALGACIVEKHFTMDRSVPGPDAAFSLEPSEFKEMVEAIRTAEAALGEVTFGGDAEEKKSRVFRRSLFVVVDVAKGEPFTAENLRSIRPGGGLHPQFLEGIVGRKASCDIAKGTPLDWVLVSGGEVDAR